MDQQAKALADAVSAPQALLENIRREGPTLSEIYDEVCKLNTVQLVQLLVMLDGNTAICAKLAAYEKAAEDVPGLADCVATISPDEDDASGVSDADVFAASLEAAPAPVVPVNERPGFCH